MNDSQFISVWPRPGSDKALGFASGGYKTIRRDLAALLGIPRLQLGWFENLSTNGQPGDWIMLYTTGKRAILIVKESL